MTFLYYTSGNGELDFEEFCDLMSRNKKDVTSHKAIAEAFKVFDKEGNGKLQYIYSVGHFSEMFCVNFRVKCLG